MSSDPIAGLVIPGVIFVAFLILGFVLRSGRGAFLIAGYNTMVPEEQKRINVQALTRLVGNSLILISVLVMVIGIAATFDVTWLVIAGVVIAIATTTWAIIYANTNKKFKNVQ